MGQSRPLFVYFRSFLTISIQIEKSVDGVLGIRTWGRRMVGADETTSYGGHQGQDKLLIKIIFSESKLGIKRSVASFWLKQKKKINFENEQLVVWTKFGISILHKTQKT